MAKILIHNNYCQLEENDSSLLRDLDRELSFMVLGAEHTQAYKGYRSRTGEFISWDGKKRLLTESLKFPIGLVDRVSRFYASRARPIDLIDCRAEKSIGVPSDLLPALQKQNKIPFDYQLEAVQTCLSHERGILRLATGAGKSILSALMVAQFGKKAILYVIGKDLLHQMHKLYSSLFPEKIGIVGDGLCDIRDVNIVSVWTAGQALGLKKSQILLESDDDEKGVAANKHQDIRDMLKSAKVHIFDECHLAACDSIQEICRTISPEHIYGLSGTPWRDDNQDLLIESYLGNKIVDISASYLIKRGFLVKPYFKFIKIPPLDYKIPRNYQTIYKHFITDNPIRNEKVVWGAQRLVEQGYPTLVLYNNVAHGKTLYDALSEKLSCALLSGKDSMDVREKVKAKLEDKKLDCIVASKIFDIGVDLPILSGLVMASGGKSSVRAYQRVGRVIRSYPGKKQAAIIDFADAAPFLREHSKLRHKFYSAEEEFEVPPWHV